MINALVPPGLQVSPAAGFAAAGAPGGPFSLTGQTCALANLSPTYTCTWSVVNTSSWLNVSLAGGMLATNAATNLTVSLNAAVADTLAAGSYVATLVITNQLGTNQPVTQTLAFSLLGDGLRDVLDPKQR